MPEIIVEDVTELPEASPISVPEAAPLTEQEQSYYRELADKQSGGASAVGASHVIDLEEDEVDFGESSPARPKRGEPSEIEAAIREDEMSVKNR